MVLGATSIVYEAGATPEIEVGADGELHRYQTHGEQTAPAGMRGERKPRQQQTALVRGKIAVVAKFSSA